jgi:hypothetical protein
MFALIFRLAQALTIEISSICGIKMGNDSAMRYIVNNTVQSLYFRFPLNWSMKYACWQHIYSDVAWKKWI